MPFAMEHTVFGDELRSERAPDLVVPSWARLKCCITREMSAGRNPGPAKAHWPQGSPLVLSENCFRAEHRSGSRHEIVWHCEWSECERLIRSKGAPLWVIQVYYLRVHPAATDMALVCTHLQQHDNMRPLSLVRAVSGLNTIMGHPSWPDSPSHTWSGLGKLVA